jgi:hypothetical protein
MGRCKSLFLRRKVASFSPQLSWELLHEIPSADGVDVLVPFIKWCGLRLLMPCLEALSGRGVPVRVIATLWEPLRLDRVFGVAACIWQEPFEDLPFLCPVTLAVGSIRSQVFSTRGTNTLCRTHM